MLNTKFLNFMPAGVFIVHMGRIVPLSYQSDVWNGKVDCSHGPVRYRTSSQGYSIVSFRSISLQNKQKKIWYVNKFQTLPNKK